LSSNLKKTIPEISVTTQNFFCAKNIYSSKETAAMLRSGYGGLFIMEQIPKTTQ
jgi:hypothetical protein